MCAYVMPFFSFFFKLELSFSVVIYLLWQIFEMPNVLKHHLWYFSESILLLMKPEEINVDCQQGNRDKIFFISRMASNRQKFLHFFIYFFSLMDVGEEFLYIHI